MPLTISKDALYARINRKLAPEHEALRRSRGWRAKLDLGDLYIVDFNRNSIVAHFVDLESIGRELGVLREWETVRDDQQ